MWAICNRHHEVFSELLRRGADVNKTDNEGFSTLQAVIEFCDLRKLEQMLIAGVDTEMRTQVGTIIIEYP
jgi:ankyrin repeat protein